MTATVAAPQGNQPVIWLVLGALILLGIVAVLVRQGHIVIRLTGASNRHGRKLIAHDEQLATLAYQMPALLEYLGVEIPAPVEDDSPEAMAAEPDADTEEFPVAPATVPDGMPLAVQSALIERPSPTPREAVMVERVVNIGGTMQTFRIRAPREDD